MGGTTTRSGKWRNDRGRSEPFILLSAVPGTTEHDGSGSLLSEIGSLEKLLADLPDDRVIERSGLEARLNILKLLAER